MLDIGIGGCVDVLCGYWYWYCVGIGIGIGMSVMSRRQVDDVVVGC
jgi:hypothetical protein